MTAIQMTVDADGIATLTMDLADRPMNVLNEAMMAPFAECIAKIEADPAVKGVIITSAKREFLAGADIDMVLGITDPKLAFDLAEQRKKMMRRL